MYASFCKSCQSNCRKKSTRPSKMKRLMYLVKGSQCISCPLHKRPQSKSSEIARKGELSARARPDAEIGLGGTPDSTVHVVWGRGGYHPWSDRPTIFTHVHAKLSLKIYLLVARESHQCTYSCPDPSRPLSHRRLPVTIAIMSSMALADSLLASSTDARKVGYIAVFGLLLYLLWKARSPYLTKVLQHLTV